MDTTESQGRITAIVSGPVMETLQQAAALTGATLSQFIVQAALEKAEMLNDPEHVILYSREDAAMLIEMLEKPGQPNAALLKAFERFKKRVDDGSLHIRPRLYAGAAGNF